MQQLYWAFTDQYRGNRSLRELWYFAGVYKHQHLCHWCLWITLSSVHTAAVSYNWKQCNNSSQEVSTVWTDLQLQFCCISSNHKDRKCSIALHAIALVQTPLTGFCFQPVSDWYSCMWPRCHVTHSRKMQCGITGVWTRWSVCDYVRLSATVALHCTARNGSSA